jgi:hypothetical protein
MSAPRINRFYLLVRHGAEQMHAPTQTGIALDASFHRRAQRILAEATPELDAWQSLDGFAHPGEHGQRILVRIEMPHP